MKVLPQQLRLYAVTDRTWLNGRRLADVVAQAIDGGATFVQLLRQNFLHPAAFAWNQRCRAGRACFSRYN